MTLPKFVARTTHIIIHNGKRKTMCTKGETISVTKWNTMNDKLKSYFEPVNVQEYEEYRNQSDKPQKSEQSAPDAERYEMMKQMMIEQESSSMQFFSKISLINKTE